MAGVTDTVFRRFIRHASMFTRDQGQGQMTAEIDLDGDKRPVRLRAADDRVHLGRRLARMRETKRRRYLTFYDDEHPIGAQLFGSNPETLAEAARIVEETGFDLVDLNLGCPAKRVVGSTAARACCAICRGSARSFAPCARR